MRWDWIKFIEVGTDGDHVHYLVQSTPKHSPSELVRLIKSITSKRIFSEHPDVKKKLWGGEFWSDDYFVSTVGKFTSEKVIKEYVKNQGKEKDYKQLLLNFPKGDPEEVHFLERFKNYNKVVLRKKVQYQDTFLILNLL